MGDFTVSWSVCVVMYLWNHVNLTLDKHTLLEIISTGYFIEGKIWCSLSRRVCGEKMSDMTNSLRSCGNN